MTSKKKKRIVIVIVIVVLIILIAIACFALLKYISSLKEQNTSGLKTQSNVILDEKKENTEERVSSVNVNINRIIKVEKNENGKYIMSLNLTNGNEHQYMFSISVENKVIYTSDLIPAGMSLPEVELDNIDLETGSYEAVVLFTVVSERDNQTVMGSTGVQLVLDVSK